AFPLLVMNGVTGVHNKLPREAFFALLERARARGLPVAVHLPSGVSSAEASDSGAASLEHIETLVESALYRTGATAKTMDQALAENSGAAGDSLSVADLVLLDGDPLDNINGTRLVNSVVLRGRVIPVAA